MRTLSSVRISVCRSSPEEMWITRPVAIKSYKAINLYTNRAPGSDRLTALCGYLRSALVAAFYMKLSETVNVNSLRGVSMKSK